MAIQDFEFPGCWQELMNCYCCKTDTLQYLAFVEWNQIILKKLLYHSKLNQIFSICSMGSKDYVLINCKGMACFLRAAVRVMRTATTYPWSWLTSRYWRRLLNLKLLCPLHHCILSSYSLLNNAQNGNAGFVLSICSRQMTWKHSQSFNAQKIFGTT